MYNLEDEKEREKENGERRIITSIEWMMDVDILPSRVGDGTSNRKRK